MNKNDEKSQTLQAIQDLLAQYEQQQLSATSVQPLMQALLEQLRVCDQAKFDAEINALQPHAFHVMGLFSSGQFSPKDLQAINIITMQTLDRMAGLFEGCQSMIFVTPPIAAFMLRWLKFTVLLVTELFKRKESQTAQLMLEMICLIHLPFYLSSLFTVLPLKDTRSKFDLQPCVLDVQDIGELAWQQYAIILCHHQEYDKARFALSALETWLAQDQGLSEFNQQQMDTLYRTQAPALKKTFKENREVWKNAVAHINTISNTLKPQILKSMRYFLLGKLALEDVAPNLSLAYCYLDLSVTHYLANKSKLTPDSLINELNTLAARFEKVENFSLAMRCYRTALKLYSEYSQVVAQYREDARQIERNMFKLKKSAFLQLKKKWEELAIESVQNVDCIDFDEVKFWCQITYSNRAFMLCHAQYLTELGVQKNMQRETRVITLNLPYELSARTLQRSFLQAQKSFQRHQHRSRQAAELTQKRFTEVVASEDTPYESHSSLEDSSFYHIACHVVRKKPKSALSKSPPPQKTPGAKIITTISWGEEYPTYHPSKGIVYPIPNPLVINSPMPKGIFYAYLDPVQLAELSKQMLDQFELQLARGKIVSKGDAHGIRSIIGELDDDSPYMFKINIHGEDIRLYGRKVATTITPDGKATVLIAFDQAIPHDEQLILQPEDRSINSNIH